MVLNELELRKEEASMPNIQRLLGRGKLYQSDQFLMDVDYEITVRHSQIVSRTMGGHSEVLEGLSEIEGYLSGTGGHGEFFNLMGSNPCLTLHLEDGQRWDCIIDDISGHAMNAGGQGLYRI